MRCHSPAGGVGYCARRGTSPAEHPDNSGNPSPCPTYAFSDRFCCVPFITALMRLSDGLRDLPVRVRAAATRPTDSGQFGQSIFSRSTTAIGVLFVRHPTAPDNGASSSAVMRSFGGADALLERLKPQLRLLHILKEPVNPAHQSDHRPDAGKGRRFVAGMAASHKRDCLQRIG